MPGSHRQTGTKDAAENIKVGDRWLVCLPGWIYTVGKQSIERINIFLCKYVSDGAIDMKLNVRSTWVIIDIC